MQVFRWGGRPVGHAKNSQYNLHLSTANKSAGIVGLIDDDLCVTVIQGLVSVLVYGIVFYPFFACLTTKYKLIGSLMGFVYATIRYEAVMILRFRNGWA